MLRIRLYMQKVTFVSRCIKPPKLLFIEDDTFFIRALHRILQEICQIDTLNTPEEVEPYLRTHTPDLILSDSIGCYELHRLQREGICYPTIILSASSYESRYDTFHILGWYEKPMPRRDIQTLIRDNLQQNIESMLDLYEPTPRTSAN